MMMVKAMFLCMDSSLLLFLCLPLTIIGQQQKKPAETAAIFRDGSLHALATLLNNQRDLFQRWNDSRQDYTKFLQALEPWITAPPAYALPSDGPFVLSPMQVPNCKKLRYSNALSGERLPKPRVIVDFVPFGYDIDLLELRFYEYWEVVDAFVVYESGITQSGYRHPSLHPRLHFDSLTPWLVYNHYCKDTL